MSGGNLTIARFADPEERRRAVGAMNCGFTVDDGNLTDSGVSVASWPWSETGSSDAQKGVDSTIKGFDPRRFPWRKVLFPLEVSLGLYLFTIYFSLQLFQQYAFQRVAIDTLSAQVGNSSETSGVLNITQCWSQDTIENATSHNIFVTVQSTTNHLNIISLLSFFFASSLMVVLWGPLSDKFGRKPFVLLAILGQILSSGLSLLIVYFVLDLRVFAASEFASGIFGGPGAMFALSLSYASDVTPKRWLTARIGLLHASGLLAAAISSGTSYRWIEHTNCNFLQPTLLPMGISVLALLFTLLIPESLPRQKRNKQSQLNKKGPLISHLLSGVKIFFYPRHIGFGRFWKLWVLALIMCIAVINDIGIAQIIPYFLHNKPYSWSYSLIGTFETADLASDGLCLIVLLPILVAAKFPDIFIGLVGILFSIGCVILTCLLKSTWKMFLVGALSGVGTLTIPITRSMMAKLIPAPEQGAAFSMLVFFELVASSISTVIYNYVYHPGAASSDQQSSGAPTYSFWLMAVLWVAAVPLLMMLLPCCNCRRRAQSTQSPFGEQRAHLLTMTESSSSSESSSSDDI